MTHLTFTNGDGQPIQIESSAVVRVRPAYGYEPSRYKAETLIDWASDTYVRETPRAVAQGVIASGVVLGVLNLPANLPFWFNPKVTTGPYAITPSNMASGARSQISIANRRLLVRDTHQEVAATLAALGVTPYPIPSGPATFPLRTWRSIEEWIMPNTVWDPDLPVS